MIAPDAATAAEVYPAAYWYAMMDLPDDAELENVPGGRNAYLMWMKNMGCVGCHQMGQLSTRTLPESIGEFESSEHAWARRISSGQAGGQMARQAEQLLGGLPIKYLADWTDRIAAGELPAAVPERPTGVERNVVATVRDWSNEKATRTTFPVPTGVTRPSMDTDPCMARPSSAPMKYRSWIR